MRLGRGRVTTDGKYKGPSGPRIQDGPLSVRARSSSLGERYGRIVRRRGKAKAQVAIARSILIIIRHLLSNPEAQFADFGYGYCQARTDTDRKIRNHIRQIQALGFEVRGWWLPGRADRRQGHAPRAPDSELTMSVPGP